MRLDQSVELGMPVFDPNTSTEQGNALEWAMSSNVETKQYGFSPEKVVKVTNICTRLLPQLQSSAWISSNDVITITLAICVDRALRPERAS